MKRETRKLTAILMIILPSMTYLYGGMFYASQNLPGYQGHPLKGFLVIIDAVGWRKYLESSLGMTLTVLCLVCIVGSVLWLRRMHSNTGSNT